MKFKRDCSYCSNTGQVASGICLPCSGIGYTTADIFLEFPIFYAYQIFNATDSTEYLALSAANKALYQLVVSQSFVDMTEGKNAKTTLWVLFGEGSNTRDNLITILGV